MLTPFIEAALSLVVEAAPEEVSLGEPAGVEVALVNAAGVEVRVTPYQIRRVGCQMLEAHGK